MEKRAILWSEKLQGYQTLEQLTKKHSVSSSLFPPVFPLEKSSARFFDVRPCLDSTFNGRQILYWHFLLKILLENTGSQNTNGIRACRFSFTFLKV